MANGVVGVSYSQTISASGGTAPYSYTVTSGSLPAGLNIDGPTGIISGTPTTAGNSTFTITATDSNSCTGTKDYTIKICPLITLSPASPLPGGSVGTPYSQTITAAGGTAPYVFSLSSGTLLDGLSLNSSTGEISGTPTTPGSFNFTIKVTDAKNCSGSKDYSISVIVNPPVIASVKEMSDPPFRLKILGNNFHPSCVVLIDGVEVQTAYKTNYKVIAKKWKTFKALLPKGVPVQITVLNKDDGGASNAVTYVR